MAILALIGLGSNLGDRGAMLDGAVAALAGTPGVELRAVSPYHETRPVGGPGGQGAFLNAAAAAETTLDPLDLIRALQQIEARSGRVRGARWGERTLDLDLLLFGDRIIDTRPAADCGAAGRPSQLRVPHPRMAFRRFVLAPLAEIAPGAVDPLTGRTVAALLANLDRRPSYVAIHDPVARSSRTERAGPPPFQRIVAGLGGVGLTAGPAPPGARLARQAEVLDAARWTPDRLGGRWLVSDFWFDAPGLDADPMDSGPGGPDFGRRFLEQRSRVVIPTFVVIDREAHAAIRRAGGLPDCRGFPPPGATPILTPDADDPEAAAVEILAACAAARGD